MQVELTGPAREFVERWLAEGRFQSADEAVQYALEFFHDCEPTRDSLTAKLREAHQAHEAGQSALLDMEEIRAELRQRLQNAQND
jgi:putative addiction module CopG family antidote